MLDVETRVAITAVICMIACVITAGLVKVVMGDCTVGFVVSLAISAVLISLFIYVSQKLLTKAEKELTIKDEGR